MIVGSEIMEIHIEEAHKNGSEDYEGYAVSGTEVRTGDKGRYAGGRRLEHAAPVRPYCWCGDLGGKVKKCTN